jgi:hypothetical protein
LSILSEHDPRYGSEALVVKVYHRTVQLDERRPHGLAEGRGGGVMTDELLVGVWVSTRRPDIRSTPGAGGVVEFDVPDSLFERYEWTGEGSPVREALIPAAVLQRYGSRPWVEPDDSVVYTEPRGAPQPHGNQPRPGGSSKAVKAVVAASALVLARRAWKRGSRG